jgi:hypothetical protein
MIEDCERQSARNGTGTDAIDDDGTITEQSVIVQDDDDIRGAESGGNNSLERQ